MVNAKRGGKILVANENPKIRFSLMSGISMVGLVFVGVFIGGGDFPRAAYLYMLFAGIAFGKVFFSFQLREMGIVYMGGLVRFNAIQYLQWENMFKKEKVKVVLHSGKTMSIKVPWEMLAPVDNYIRNYSPHI